MALECAEFLDKQRVGSFTFIKQIRGRKLLRMTSTVAVVGKVVNMNSFDDWSQIISKFLKSETDPLNILSKHDLEGDSARVAFIRSVLDRFLPEIYGVGSGQIMDSKGNLSGEMDIIIYRRDFPRLDLPGSRDTYLYESVIATIQTVAKLVKKSFFDALNQCAALGELNPDIDQKVMIGLAAKNQLTMNENRVYVHPDPLRTGRFQLIARPLSFIYAFSGYKTSPRQLAESLEAWMQERREAGKPVDMKSMPSVIATQGCFAWRNSAPYTVNTNCLMGVGVDQAPIRLIILQMLHTLSRRLKVTTDSFGLKPGLDGYLNRMPPPVMESFIGKARNPLVGEEANVKKLVKPATPVAKPEPKPVVAKEQQAKPVTVSAKPAVKPIEKPAPERLTAAVEKPVVEATEKPLIEIRPKPTAVPPPAPVATEKPVEKQAAKTLGSFDRKPEAVDAPFPVPNADLIPELDPNPPEIEGESEPHVPAFAKPVASVTNISKSAAKPTDDNSVKATPIDIKLEPPVQAKSAPIAAVDSAEKFLETMKLNISTPEKKASSSSAQSSADEFLETMKMQLSNSEPFPHLQPKSEPEPEPFTSTIPQ